MLKFIAISLAVVAAAPPLLLKSENGHEIIRVDVEKK